jgi:hypothetical protein
MSFERGGWSVGNHARATPLSRGCLGAGRRDICLCSSAGRGSAKTVGCSGADLTSNVYRICEVQPLAGTEIVLAMRGQCWTLRLEQVLKLWMNRCRCLPLPLRACSESQCVDFALRPEQEFRKARMNVSFNGGDRPTHIPL